jgi:hypothetical protein
MKTLSTTYEKRYLEMLKAAVTATKPEEVLTSFWPMRGDSYKKGGLMIVGRAVNGWRHEFTMAQLQSDGDIRRIGLNARLISETPGSKEIDGDRFDERPMEWVARKAGKPGKEYNTKRSAFWRVAKKITVKDEDGWATYLCWSNLYKIAPHKGRNPRSSLRTALAKTSADLLGREVATFKPQNVVVFAGLKWFEPFAEQLNLTKVQMKRKAPVEAVYRDDRGTQWIVAPHPERKKEGPIVKAILRAMASNEKDWQMANADAAALSAHSQK